MARIHKRETIEKIMDEAGIQTSVDEVPQHLASKVVPVLVANDELGVNINNASEVGGSTYDLQVDGNQATNDSTTVIHRTHATKTTYAVGCQLGVIKDVNSTSIYSAFQLTYADGTTHNALQIPGITLTVQSEVVSIVFPQPIELKKDWDAGVAISSTNVATISMAGSLLYYEE